jgi:hypothetical protein
MFASRGLMVRDASAVIKPRPAPLQAKFLVGGAHDPLEAQADRVAEQVMRSPASRLRDERDPVATSTPGRASPGGTPDAWPGGATQPLDSSLRAWFEPRFGVDFSRVRIYADEHADASARSLGARAFTTGPHIVFGGGQYRPETDDGRMLLAHELTHVMQQGHAAALDGGGAVRMTAPGTSMIQRDTPDGSAGASGTLSITKSYDPINASRDEVVKDLTAFLSQEQVRQGGRQLKVDDRVRTAVLALFREMPVEFSSMEMDLSKDRLVGSPADVAAKVGARLPDFIARKYTTHLLKGTAAQGTATKSRLQEGKQQLNEKLNEIGKPPVPEPAPNGPVEAPSIVPTLGGSDGQHVYSIPPRSWGGPPRQRIPKSSLPQTTRASESDAVNKIVQALDDDALIPVAVRGTPRAEEFPSAKAVAQEVANLLAAAQAKGQSSVNLPIGVQQGATDIGTIERIVLKIAAALPGGVQGVNEVIITTRPLGKGPARIQGVVKLHGER